MHHLLKTPDTQARNDLILAQAAIRASFPLKTIHRKDLPLSVQELSLLLTAERTQIQGYWQKPSLTGAYLYYFLPWNLLRLTWLLPDLPLELHNNTRILDLGSGPLTIPLGFWLARPESRELAISITCSDPAQRPMELGRSVLENLQPEGKMGKNGQWDVRLLRAPIEVALRKAGKVDLITAGNVLNEISPRQARLEERLEEIFFSMDRALEAGGQIFLLEPGTRLGGKLISLMRRIALGAGYKVEAPCTHDANCPYAPQEDFDDDDDAPIARKTWGRGAVRPPSGWCHFTLPPEGAPIELLELSRASQLEKERLSFSCLLLRKPGVNFHLRANADFKNNAGGSAQLSTNHQPASAQPSRNANAQASFSRQDKIVSGGVLTPVRVISDPIKLPQTGTRARYVCSRHGLGLLHQTNDCKSGMLVEALMPEKTTRDVKSGAVNMYPAQQAGRPLPAGYIPVRPMPNRYTPDRQNSDRQHSDQQDLDRQSLGRQRLDQQGSDKQSSDKHSSGRPQPAGQRSDKTQSGRPQPADEKRERLQRSDNRSQGEWTTSRSENRTGDARPARSDKRPHSDNRSQGEQRSEGTKRSQSGNKSQGSRVKK